jgi:Phytanoyl-CoA dioxygenase (PhyH)
MWIPVDPVSFNSGTIRYVRGSHRWGFFKPNVFVSQMAFPGADGGTLPDMDGHEEEYDIVSSELEPGDLLVHHHLTVHGSAGNATLRRRFKFSPYAPAQSPFPPSAKDGDRSIAHSSRWCGRGRHGCLPPLRGGAATQKREKGSRGAHGIAALAISRKHARSHSPRGVPPKGRLAATGAPVARLSDDVNQEPVAVSFPRLPPLLAGVGVLKPR